MDLIISTHAEDVLIERKIDKELVLKTANDPDYYKKGIDDNNHYFKVFKMNDEKERVLHVVVNLNVLPNKVVTAFYDRREIKNRRK